MQINQEEQDFLNFITDKITKKITDTESANKTLLDDLKDNMRYMWDSIYEMDSAERSFVKNQMAMLDEAQQDNIKELVAYRASLKSPYFGAIDFKSKHNELLSYRIGLKGIKENETIYVVDWRAPFSELYYNFDKGPAFFTTNEETVEGEILHKDANIH